MKRHSDYDPNTSKRIKGDERTEKSTYRHDRPETKHERSEVRNTNSERPVTLRTFPVYPKTHFDNKFPNFRKPTEIGYFSQDYKRTFKDNSSQLNIYYPPHNVCKPNNAHALGTGMHITDINTKTPHKVDNVAYDLRKGYDIFIKRDDSVNEFINDLLRWILQHKDVFSLHEQKESENIFSLSTDFVSWRGLYTKLLCTPYENREGWKISVTKYNNTFYMCEFKTEQRIEQEQHDTERQKEMSYWGVKFEQYVTAEPGHEPVTDRPVNNHEAFCSVVRARLDKHSLVFGGEIDCFETVDGKKKYVELKTSREIEHPRQLANFKRFKAIKWWAQSFMVGIDKIVCGFRDDNGIVHHLDSYNVQELPKYCKDIPNCWEPNICFNFVNKFLQHVKDTVQEDDPHIAYVFTWNPREPIQCKQFPPKSEYSFLPDWYIEATYITEHGPQQS